MHQTTKILATCGLALSLAACARPSSRPSPSSRAELEHQGQTGAEGAMARREQGEGEICPVGIAALRARSENIRDGGAIVLTTRRSDAVPELRQRVARFVTAHGRADAQHQSIEGAREDRSHLAMASVRAVDVRGGSRIEAKPRDANEVRALRRELRDDARDISNGRCPVAWRAEP